MGVLFLGIKGNLRKAVLYGNIVFLCSLLIFRLWSWLLPLNTPNNFAIFNPTILSLLFPLHEALVGLIIGAIIGYMKAGWKMIGWYALVGAIGMAIGFLWLDIVGKSILAHSPYASDISLLVVGSTWYYLYFIVPAAIQGLTLGMFIYLAEIPTRRSSKSKMVSIPSRP